MTHEEIDKMEAGRELDRRVAELVMGGEVMMGVVTFGSIWNPETENHQPHFVELPNYSTNISDAMRLIDTWHPDLTIHRYLPGKWGVTLSRSIFSSNPADHFDGEADTLPLAICRCALKAKAVS